ncbi:hypothetical protein HDF16_003931 [Granulicella aggregans]|uniref:Uncharacterized protein n=1 Tax=Granulicella aggregans TaxID=474949 RepID=A0A7W8E4M4_9BACT|nr:hypothetical protein [Granulicella aggregans]
MVHPGGRGGVRTSQKRDAGHSGLLWFELHEVDGVYVDYEAAAGDLVGVGVGEHCT